MKYSVTIQAMGFGDRGIVAERGIVVNAVVVKTGVCAEDWCLW